MRFGKTPSRKRCASGPLTSSLPSVDTSITPGRCVHGADLRRRVAVVVRPPPGPGPDHARAVGDVAAVQRRPLARDERAPGERAQRRRRPRRARGRRAERRLVGPGGLRRARARTPAGTGGPGTGPSSRSCSAWRSRRRRSPRATARRRSLAVTSSQWQTKQRPVVRVRRRRREHARALAGHRADRLDPVGELGRREDAAAPRRSAPCRRPGRSASTPAGARRTRRVGRSRPGGRRSRPRPAVRAARAPAAAAAARSRRSTTSATSAPAPRSRSAAASAVSSAASTTARRPGRIDHRSSMPQDGARRHHAREVVAVEQQRLLDRPGGDDDVAGADAVHDVAAVHRHEPALEDAERARRRDHLDACEREAGRLRLARPRARPRGPSARSARAAAAARAPAADDQHVDEPVLDVRARGPRVGAGGAPEPGHPPQRTLDVRPRPSRADARPVVEARPA